MLKKTITFKDLDDNDVTEDFYFNLTKAELAELELSRKGGLTAHLQQIIKDGDGGVIMATFKELISKSVGRRSEDGRRFIKNQEITDEFLQSNAYSEMFLGLVTSADDGAAFIRAIVPKDMLDAVDAGQPAIPGLPEAKDAPAPVEALKPGSREFYIDKLKDPTWVPSKAQLVEMDEDLMKQAFARKASAPQS